MGLRMRHGRAQTAAVSPRPPRELTQKPPHRADPFCTGRAGEKRPGSNGDGISACPWTEPQVMLCTGHRHLAERLPDRRLPPRKPRRPACHRPRARSLGCSLGCSARKPPSQPPLNQRGAQPPQAVPQDLASVLTGPHTPRPPAPSAESRAQTFSSADTCLH